MRAFVYGGLIWVVTVGEIYLVQYLDAAAGIINRKEKILVPACSVLNGVLIAWIVNLRCLNNVEAGLLAVFAGCMMFACLTDVKTCYVYQFVWWVAGAAGGFFLWSALDRVLPLLVYIILQELFFCRFYGRADCHAFAMCSVMLCALGMGMTEYLIHMLLAFAGLAAVQLFVGNVNRRGNLKRPVAFLPYITLSFWVLLFF